MVKVAGCMVMGVLVAVAASQGHAAEAELAAVPVFSPATVDPTYDAPVGIEFDGTNLVIANGAWNGEFLRFTRQGAFLSAFDPPGIAPGDLTWDGSTFYYSDEFDHVVRQIDANGNVLRTFSIGDFSSARVGLAWDGRYLWAVNGSTGAIAIYDVNTAGDPQRIRTFAGPDSQTLALAWDGQSMWAATLFGRLYRLAPDGSVIDGPYTVQNVTRIYGLTFDGKDLYATDPVSDFVYRITLPVASGDGDNDGVADGRDACPATAPGAPVDARGCSVADLCPCAGPWKNHGAYVSCVSRTSSAFFKAGIVTREQKRALNEAAARSTCGR